MLQKGGPLLRRHAAVRMPRLGLSQRLRRLVAPEVLHLILQGECIIPRFVSQHLRSAASYLPVPSMSSMSSMGAPTVGAPAMEEGMGARTSSVARPAGGAGMPCRRRMQVAARVGRCMRVTARVGRRMPGETPAMLSCFRMKSEQQKRYRQNCCPKRAFL